MKNDIDFDELDKAVGAVLGGSQISAVTETSSGSQPAPAETPAVTKPVDQPVADKKPVTSKAVKPAAKPASPALKRSSGRFMDMVHPSADMKKATPANPSTTASHAGLKLQPLSSDVKTTALESPASSPVENSKSTQSNYEPGPPDLAASGFVSMPDDDKAAASTTDWPDPLDVDKAQAETKPVDDPASTADGATGTNPVIDSPEPVDGPFLNDQKVEKRPLGAFAGEPQSSDEAVASNQPSPEADLQMAPAPVPAELQPEAVEVEASEVPEKPDDETVGNQTDTAMSDESSNASVPVDNSDKLPAPSTTDDESSKSETDSASTVPVEKPAVDTVNLSGQSIAPQYKSQPTDNDDVTAATSVFDTQEYHQPLTPSVGRKSLKKVVGLVGLVVLLVLIGAAIGYAYYVYRTGGF